MSDGGQWREGGGNITLVHYISSEIVPNHFEFLEKIEDVDSIGEQGYAY